MKILHGRQAEERISKWMKTLKPPENNLSVKNFGVKDSFESNKQSDLSEKESINFDLENSNAADAKESEALFHNLGMDSTKAVMPEDEKIIFSLPEDLKRMNISFKDKRKELNQLIRTDPFGRIVFDSRFHSRKQFTDMNVLGSVPALQNIRNII